MRPLSEIEMTQQAYCSILYKHDLSGSLYMAKSVIFRQLGLRQYTEEEALNFAHWRRLIVVHSFYIWLSA